MKPPAAVAPNSFKAPRRVCEFDRAFESSAKRTSFTFPPYWSNCRQRLLAVHLLPARERVSDDGEDLVFSSRRTGGKRAVGVDQEGDRRFEDPVLLRDAPSWLESHAETDI